MTDHESVCHPVYCHLQQIRLTLQSLSADAEKALVQAFISTRLDYCNSILYGVTDNLIQRLQSVQNAAARLSRRQVSVNTSHPFCGNYIGYRSNAVSSSSWLC